MTRRAAPCRTHTNTSNTPNTSSMPIEQEDRAVDRGAGAVSVVLGDARQKRADRGDRRQRQIVRHLGFLPGQEHSQDHAAHRRRGDQVAIAPPSPIRPPRPRSTSRSTPGARPRRATSPIRRPATGRKELARARQGAGGGTRPGDGANITTTRSPRRRSRSASCSPRRR